MRVRIVATYATVAVVNATAGWLHLAGGESALGWAFILATLAFLLLGWEADGRLARREQHVAAGPDEDDPSLARLEPPAPRRTGRAPRPRRALVRRLAWLGPVAVTVGLELHLLAGLDMLATLCICAAILTVGLALPPMRPLPSAQRRTP